MGLHQNEYNPCLFTGCIINPSIPADIPSTSPIALGLYVDDFVYFSANAVVEEKFQRILKELVTVNFMGTLEWFLGTHFQWMITPEIFTVHLSQTGFAANLAEENNIHHCSTTHDETPYCSGLPIDAIAESDEDKECPIFLKRKQKYQSIVGSIGWLAQNTWSDLSPSHSFLSAYCNKPLQSHLNAALYVLHYIHSTIDYGFTFTLSKQVTLHTFMSYPHSSDTEAYHDAIPPKKDGHHCLTTYSDACWGSQLGNAVQEGVQLPLFKFRSMSGAIIFCSGGPITWKEERQERTALSSCDTEICTTNMGSRLTVNTRNMISHLSSISYPIKDTNAPMPLFNNNEACVQWCHNMTSKGNRHIELKKNSVQEWVEDGTITGTHVAGKYNPSNIFTKEIAMVQIFDAFPIPSCVGVQISLNRYSTIFIQKQNSLIPHLTILYMSPRQQATFSQQPWESSMCSYQTHPSNFLWQSHVYVVLVDRFYLMLYLRFYAGLHEQSYGGCHCRILLPVIAYLS